MRPGDRAANVTDCRSVSRGFDSLPGHFPSSPTAAVHAATGVSNADWRFPICPHSENPAQWLSFPAAAQESSWGGAASSSPMQQAALVERSVLSFASWVHAIVPAAPMTGRSQGSWTVSFERPFAREEEGPYESAETFGEALGVWRPCPTRKAADRRLHARRIPLTSRGVTSFNVMLAGSAGMTGGRHRCSKS